MTYFFHVEFKVWIIKTFHHMHKTLLEGQASRCLTCVLPVHLAQINKEFSFRPSKSSTL